MGHKHGYDWHETMFFSLRQFIYLHISCEYQSVELERIIAKYVLSNSTLLEIFLPLGAKQLEPAPSHIICHLCILTT